jgi:TPR repeat protein
LSLVDGINEQEKFAAGRAQPIDQRPAEVAAVTLEPAAEHVDNGHRGRAARLLLVQTYHNGGNVPNDYKLYQKAINYTK